MNSESSASITTGTGTLPAGKLPPAFAPTRWTLVVRARGDSPEARTALSELCAAYYEPVLNFLQRERRNDDIARELAQEFFTRILSGSGFEGAEPERGRFRSYVLGALKHFLADLRDREHRQKRGGGTIPESLDAPSPEDHSPALAIADHSALPPDDGFDRQWALTVMARTLGALEQEMISTGKTAQFQVLKPWLMGDGPAISQAEAARQLNLTEGAVKVAVHRLRKRFRELLRSEIAQTLRDPANVDQELRHLISALS